MKLISFSSPNFWLFDSSGVQFSAQGNNRVSVLVDDDTNYNEVPKTLNYTRNLYGRVSRVVSCPVLVVLLPLRSFGQ